MLTNGHGRSALGTSGSIYVLALTFFPSIGRSKCDFFLVNGEKLYDCQCWSAQKKINVWYIFSGADTHCWKRKHLVRL